MTRLSREHTAPLFRPLEPPIRELAIFSTTSATDYWGSQGQQESVPSEAFHRRPNTGSTRWLGGLLPDQQLTSTVLLPGLLVAFFCFGSPTG